MLWARAQHLSSVNKRSCFPLVSLLPASPSHWPHSSLHTDPNPPFEAKNPPRAQHASRGCKVHGLLSPTPHRLPSGCCISGWRLGLLSKEPHSSLRAWKARHLLRLLWVILSPPTTCPVTGQVSLPEAVTCPCQGLTAPPL